MELFYSGIKNQEWGRRRYQGPDGNYTELGLRRLREQRRKADQKWMDRHADRIQKKTEKAVKRDMDRYAKKTLDPEFKKSKYISRGKLSAAYINAYNRKLAELMNKKLGTVETPSGMVMSFIAKRGEIGVLTGISDHGYDMSQLKNGVYGDGRVAYKKNTLEKI